MVFDVYGAAGLYDGVMKALLSTRCASLVLVLGATACGQTDPPYSSPPNASSSDVDSSVADVRTSVDASSDLPTTGADVGLRSDMTSDDVDVEPNSGPTRYVEGPIAQPITRSVVSSLQGIRNADGSRNEDVFIKVGASGTVNPANLTCFGPTSSYRVDLAGRDELSSTIDYFNSTVWGAQSSWDRTTLAAEVGRTAGWAQTGDPSPLDAEIAALNPRFALVNYGTNDMQQGVTHRSALFPFVDNMQTLLDDLIARGIIPVVTGLNPRTDSATAALWVPTYNVVTRALAERRQLPYIDLFHAVKDLPNSGLIADGIHGNSYSDGGSQPCVFDPDGLGFNYNIRNLETLQLLHAVRTNLFGTAEPADSPAPWFGTGAPNDPFEVDVLPFSHHADTRDSPHSVRDAYPDCDSGQDESGPEWSYELTLQTETALRIAVFDEGDVDVDLHLLSGESCRDRHDRMIEGTYAAGQYTIVVDTYVSTAGPRSGAFSLVVLRCEPGDADCG